MSGNVLESTPLVSVIVPTYNGAKYVQDAIFSILQQSYSNMEILVCDDVSKDQTIDLVQRIQDEQDLKNQIQLITQSHNQGISRNMNTGLEAANGKYIAILDHDDVRLDRNKIKQQVSFLEDNEDYGIIGTNYITGINGKDKRITLPCSDEEIRSVVLGKCPMQHSSVVYRKELINYVGLYSSKFKCALDYDLFLRILKESKGANIPGYMTFYRLHKSNISRIQNKMQKKEALELARTNKSQFPNSTKAIICRTGNLVLSTFMPNTELYRELQLNIKNRY